MSGTVLPNAMLNTSQSSTERAGRPQSRAVVVADGAHLAVANSMALKMLGVTKGVSTLKGGGSAILDQDGEPNGTLTDSMGAVPTTPTLDDLERYYTSGIQDFWTQYGFTSLLAITPAAAERDGRLLAQIESRLGS